MKTLKFIKELVPSIVNGNKATTLRFFDDKDLAPGDIIGLINKNTGENFARAEIWNVSEKFLKDLSSEDWDGHEEVSGDMSMEEYYSKLYNRPINGNTPVKIVKFRLIH